MPVVTKFRLFPLALLAAIGFSAGLSGCGSSGSGNVSIVVVGDRDAPFESGATLSAGSQLVRGATEEGLVGLDAEGRVTPALADRWIVTDDGQSYIFRLRDGIWPDGSVLTGESARAALRGAIAAQKGRALALDLADIADVRAMAGRVVEIRLSRPMPDLLQLLAQPELGLMHKSRGAGPMALTRDGSIAMMTPIAPEARGLPAVENWAQRIRSLKLFARPAQQAVDAFDQGDADVLLGGRIEDFPRADIAGLSRGTIRIDPVIGLFGLSFRNSDGFLAMPENREAISMAIDREALAGAFGVGGWKASTRIVSPDVADDLGTVGERWTGLNLAGRRAAANVRVVRWKAAHGAPAPLRIALPKGPGADILFSRIRGDLQAIGLTVVRVPPEGAADLKLVDAVAQYPGAAWFLNQLSCGVQKGLCSEAADMRVAESRTSDGTASRSASLAEAEVELTAANTFIPFGPPIRWSLVRADVTGFSPNRLGFHPLMPFAMRPK